MVKVGVSGVIAAAFVGRGVQVYVREEWVPIDDCTCNYPDTCTTTVYRVVTDYLNGTTVERSWDFRDDALLDLKERAAG